MKKIVALILAVTMILSMGLLTGCSDTSGNNGGTEGGNTNQGGNEGGNNTASGYGSDKGYDGSAVTITFYHTMGQNLRDVLDAYIEEFNAMYPNITIVHEQVGGYDDVRDQISTEIGVGNQPNIAYCYPDHVALYNLAGAVITLDSLIGSTVEVTKADGTKEAMGMSQAQVDNIIDGFYAEGAAFGDGKMYTLPLSKSTEVMYYDKTFFEANDLDVPTTWDEVKAVCEKIKAIDPNSIPLGYDSEANWFINMCMQYGSDYTSATGDHYLFNNDTNKAFIEQFREWYQAGYVTTQTLYGAYTSGLFTSTNGVRCYMCIGSSAGATYQRPTAVDGAYPFEVGIASIPQVDASKPQVISQGPSLCIFDADEQEVYASWLFVKYLTTCVEFQAEFSMVSGYMPVLESVTENEVYAEWLGKADGGDFIAALSVKVSLDQANAYYTSPAFNGSSVARDQVGDLLTKALSTTTSLDGLFEDAVDECEYQAPSD